MKRGLENNRKIVIYGVVQLSGSSKHNTSYVWDEWSIFSMIEEIKSSLVTGSLSKFYVLQLK